MKKLKNFLLTFLAFLFITLTIQTFYGCSTSLYGKTLVPDQTQSDQYTLKVYVGGFASSKTASKKAVKEINKYMKDKGYSSYKIISQGYHVAPSYYNFVVKLTK